MLGAFIPGVPVQPVLMRYPNKLVSDNDCNAASMYFTPHLESKLYRGHATSFIEAEPKDEMHPVGIQYSTHTCSINNLFISIRAVVYGFISELDLHIFVDLLCCLPCQVLGIRWTVSLTERLAPVLNWKPCEQASVWTSVYFSFSQCRRRNLLHVWANWCLFEKLLALVLSLAHLLQPPKISQNRSKSTLMSLKLPFPLQSTVDMDSERLILRGWEASHLIWAPAPF